MGNKISFQSIVDIDHWQKIQDHFAEVVKLTLWTVDGKGKILSKPSNSTKLCSEVLKGSDLWLPVCAGCLPRPEKDKSRPEKSEKSIREYGRSQYMGLCNFSIPVRIPKRGQTIAYLLVGPVLVGPPQKPSGYRQLLQEKGIDFADFVDGLIEISRFSFSGIQSVIELISEVGCYIAGLRYEKFRLGRSILKFNSQKKRVREVLLDRLLKSLLDVAFDATDAEVGTIMVFDEKTGELYIKLNRGLRKDIASRARLKPGEGIAGLVAQENRLLLLDDKFTAKRIRERFRRPGMIKSAVVAPLAIKGETFGVINLSTFNPVNRFDAPKIKLLSQLIRLVDVSLSSDIPL